MVEGICSMGSSFPLVLHISKRERRSLEKEGSRIPCVRPAERSRWRGLERTALLRGRSRATS